MFHVIKMFSCEHSQVCMKMICRKQERNYPSFFLLEFTHEINKNKTEQPVKINKPNVAYQIF